MQENLSPTKAHAWARLLPVAAWLLAMGGAAAIAGERVRGLIATTTAVAGPAALLAVGLGLPVAVFAAKRRSRLATAWLVILGTLAIAPLHAVAAAWLATLGGQGALPRFFGVAGPTACWLSGVLGAVWVHAVAATPLAALLTAAALRAVDPRREEQALLEAPAGVVLRRVALRDAGGAIVAAGVLVATLAAAEIAVTDLMRVRTFAEEVYTQVATGELLGVTDATGAVTRMTAGVAVLALVAAAALRGYVRRTRPAWDAAAMGRGLSLRGSLARRWSAAAAVSVLLVAATPMASLVRQAGVSVDASSGSPRRVWSVVTLVSNVADAPVRHRRELAVSASLGVGVATITTSAAIAIAWAARRRRVLGAAAVGLAAAALATPGPVWGLAAIRLLNQPPDGVLAILGELYDSWVTVALVQAARLTPLILLAVWPALAATPGDALDAARADGAGPLTRFLRVAAVWRSPTAVAAWLVAFALSVGELPATALVCPPGTPPLSVRLLTLLHYGVEDRVAALCLVLLGGCGLVATAAAALLRRSPPPAPGAPSR
ncbi:MAG: hypothetical protein AAF805_12065 [Planctomycetota bacterium]